MSILEKSTCYRVTSPKTPFLYFIAFHPVAPSQNQILSIEPHRGLQEKYPGGAYQNSWTPLSISAMCSSPLVWTTVPSRIRPSSFTITISPRCNLTKFLPYSKILVSEYKKVCDTRKRIFSTSFVIADNCPAVKHNGKPTHVQ